MISFFEMGSFLKKGSLNYTISFGGFKQTMQNYGNFEGFPLQNVHCLGLVSYEQWKNPGCLGYIGDDKLASLIGDYNKPLYGSLLINQDSMESNKGFFRGTTPLVPGRRRPHHFRQVGENLALRGWSINAISVAAPKFLGELFLVVQVY